jgi:hypothetical protein
VVALFIGPWRERSGWPTVYGGCAFHGDWSLWGGEREAVGAGVLEGEAMGP